MTEIVHTEFRSNTEGVFKIPAELYHNHKEAPEISRGILVRMAAESPAHVLQMIQGSVKKPTKAMISGVLADLALLEPENFKEGLSHWILPEGLKLTTKEGIAWKKDHSDLPVLKSKTDAVNEASAEDIQGIIASVMKHKLGRRIVESSIKQESAFCFDPDTHLLRKCRPDTRMVDNSSRLTIADLKTTFPGGTTISNFSRICAAKNYHIQDAFYSEIYKDLLGERPYFIFMVVERKPPYSVRVFQIHEEGKRAGSEECKASLEKFAQCKASGIWPDYPEVIETVTLPRWKLEQPEPVE